MPVCQLNVDKPFGALKSRCRVSIQIHETWYIIRPLYLVKILWSKSDISWSLPDIFHSAGAGEILIKFQKSKYLSTSRWLFKGQIIQYNHNHAAACWGDLLHSVYEVRTQFTKENVFVCFLTYNRYLMLRINIFYTKHYKKSHFFIKLKYQKRF